MSSWLFKARSKTVVGQNTTGQQGSIKASDGDDQPQMIQKATTDQIYRPSVTPGQPGLLPVYISVYNLDWTELLPLIKAKFPKQTFDEKQTGVGDYYLIYAPRRLTQGEEDEIELIRKAHRESVAHGPGGRRRRLEHSPDGPRKSHNY